MPPDESELLLESQYKFERSMANLNKLTYGIKRDLPVEIDSNIVVPQALIYWNDGRIALNNYFIILF